jgi:hypothetical protein
MSLLLSVPLWAMSAPVGTVAYSNGTRVGSDPAASGTSLYNGDTLSVNSKGKASILLNGGSRAIISPNSEARVVRDGSALALELMSGGVGISSTAKSHVEGKLADVTFRPENPAKAAIGYMVFKNPNHPIFYADKGDWLLTTGHDGHSMVLHSGDKIEGMMTDNYNQSNQQGETPEQANKNNKSKKWAVIWIGTALVGTVTGLALAFGQSECTIGNGPGCVVSPTTPQTPQ